MRANIRAASRMPDIANWVEDKFYDPQFTKPAQTDFSQTPKVRLTQIQKRYLRHCFTINPLLGRFPYTTIVISKPKKSGKSTVGAMIGCWFAENVEPPNVVNILAKDREQSNARVFAFAKPTLTSIGAVQHETRYKRILPNGTIVQALTSDAEKEAGGSYGLTLWDELWAFRLPSERLLWDELIPILTRNTSMRVVVSYAGFEDTSDLLLSLYLSVFTDTTETELQVGARPVEELKDITTTNSKGQEIPCFYEVPRIGLFYYNDHDQRMPWQQGEKAAQIRAETESSGMLETNIYRLMENRWQKTEERFLHPNFLEGSFKFKASVSTSHKMTFAIDAAMRHDCVALCGVYELGKYKTGYAKAWDPKGKDIDLEATVIQELLSLWRAGVIQRREPLPVEKELVKKEQLTCIDVWYDPYQMHQVMTNLWKQHRLKIAEFGQKTERVKADTFLLQKYSGYKIDNLDSGDLYSHLEAARAEAQTDANTELIRIVKGTGQHAKPIDLAVAQSMALCRGSKRPKVISFTGIPQGAAKKGW